MSPQPDRRHAAAPKVLELFQEMNGEMDRAERQLSHEVEVLKDRLRD